MSEPVSRRRFVQTVAAAGAAAPMVQGQPPMPLPFPRRAGAVAGRMMAARAMVETLLAEGCECVYGIPGAQMNEIWDQFKTRRLPYLLASHEYSAACMADGYARSKGKPGVLCIVPGPGLTNALTGIGEALLDSIPMVCIVGDVAIGRHARPFQVHSLPTVPLLQNVTKHCFAVSDARQIPDIIRHAFRMSLTGEPGPVGVVVPYNLLFEVQSFRSEPLPPPDVPFDPRAFEQAICLLRNRRWRVGIYAGLGCMDYSPALVRLAEVLQAPVATSICGKGAMPEDHPLAVGWGYGPQGRRTAENAFRQVDLVLAIGVKYSEVSTGVYSQPRAARQIHVDACRDNLGRIMPTDVCVHADAGLFMERCLERADEIRRPANRALICRIERDKRAEQRLNAHVWARCGADPMALLMTLRRLTCPDAMFFVDVTCSQYWATEVIDVTQPRTFFNPTDNQAMGWSIPAAIGAQMVHPGRQTVTITGDGCFFMSAMELATAVRANLPVKFFILDDQAYHYMQLLQESAYRRTTATILPRLDYAALARGLNISYQEISQQHDLEASVRAALAHPGPVLVRVVTDYRIRPIRWIQAARRQFVRELNPQQQARFAARLGVRTLQVRPEND